MNTVKVLIEGYAQTNPDGTWDATCSTTFIDTGKHKIIVDPGCHRQFLLKALKAEHLKVGDIDYVFLSHYHLDHSLLMGIFDQATILDGTQWQKGPLGGEIVGDTLPDTDIKIIKTPGHTPDHSSLLVSTEKGRILIGADVFWWKVGEKQVVDMNHPDDFASDPSTLKLSRSYTLEIADFIIPGHGRLFPTH